MSEISEKRILIVDDQPDNLKILARQLKMYTSDLASNGHEALRMAEENKPDLILLDVMMPEMDGFAVAKKLKGNPSTASIPIIFVTAKTDVGSFIEGFDLGADEYIMKPYDPNVVRQVVKNKLDPAMENEEEEF
jgi:putative two-component system response regulator